MAHGGGKKMEPDSDEYKLIRRWIAAGMPLGDENDPTVTKITVYPEHRVLTAQQQAAVRRLRPLHRRHGRGHHPPGPVREQRHRDRRRRCERGLVRTLGHERRGGDHGPLPGHGRRLPRHGAARREDARLAVRREDRRRQVHARRSGRNSASCRRNCAPTSSSSAASTLDITGTLPTPKQVTDVRRRQGRRQARQAGRPAARHAGVRLLLRQQVGRHPPRQARGSRPTGPQGTFAFHDWIREQVADGHAVQRVRPRRSWRPAATSGRTRRPCGTRSSTSPSSSWTT